jgi:hypothetical protein
MSEEKLKITVQEVEQLLEKGLQRPEIAEHFGVPLSILQKTVFQHPKLKGRKAKKIYNIEIVDEEENAILDAPDQVTEDSVNGQEIRGEETLAETVSPEELPQQEEIAQEVETPSEENAPEVQVNW